MSSYFGISDEVTGEVRWWWYGGGVQAKGYSINTGTGIGGVYSGLAKRYLDERNP
jgi:hypothetical protein